MASRNSSGNGFHADLFGKWVTGFHVRLSDERIDVSMSDDEAKKVMQDALLFLGINEDNYKSYINVDKHDNFEWLYEVSPDLPTTERQT